MSFDTRPGSRGTRQPKGWLARTSNSMMARRLRSKGRKGHATMMGLDALALTTIGRKSGLERSVPVGWFPDGDGNWLIAASANGATDNPAWYYNLAAHPDQARIDLDGETIPVHAEQLHGEQRDQAWAQIIAAVPRFARYEKKTDREIPVIRLTRRDA